jgi:hypothetical protein
MPNQTGSKPKVVTMGRKTGEQIIHIPTGSMNIPRILFGDDLSPNLRCSFAHHVTLGIPTNNLLKAALFLPKKKIHVFRLFKLESQL